MTALVAAGTVEIVVELGIGRPELAGRWDEAGWDANVWAESDTTLGDWVDVTCQTGTGMRMTAGANESDGVVTRWEAATLQATLGGPEWDPAEGPYAGVLGPGVQARVRWRTPGAAEWVTAFDGFTNEDGFQYDGKGRAQIACTDATGIIAGYDGLEQLPQGAGETAAQRVARIADAAEWPADRRDITPGGVTVKSTTLAENAWTMLLQVADTDLALLWVDRAGRLAYRPQARIIPARDMAAQICGNPDQQEPGCICPVEIVGQQPTIARNIVSISRQADEGTPPATVTVRDDESVARFKPRTYQRTDLIHQSDAWSRVVAEAILTSSAWPSNSPRYMTLDSRADQAAAALLLTLEPSRMVLIKGWRGKNWACEPVGWDVGIYPNRIDGVVNLIDVTQWWGSEWDFAVWDTDRWGY